MTIAASVATAVTTTHDAIAGIKNRKFLLGMAFLGGCFAAIGLCIVLHPEALLGLAACLGGTGTGVIGMVWGISKERPTDAT